MGLVVTIEISTTMMNFHNLIMRNADGYSVELRCYSVAFFGKISADKVTKINRSDKVSAFGVLEADKSHSMQCILPESMLDTLTRMNVPFPMLFKVERKDRESGRTTASTHVGVMEFIAEEGRCYLPHWVRALFSTHHDIHFNRRLWSS